jgi:hypothetical protein
MPQEIPLSLFLLSIRPKAIFKFKNDEFDDKTGHYHICIEINADEILTLVLCTSQFESLKKQVKLRNLPYETLVPIKANSELPFTKETYVDCNKYFSKSKTHIADLYQKGELEGVWELHDDAYQQIIEGMIESPIIENVLKKRLRILLEEFL